ncbi:MAG: hypothetical protein IJA34_04245 [Lachnospiraceae bacterium]|nr:hypothetical protein [Lachnospiraceae bacterium]
MKYYIMTRDKMYTDVPQIINWFGKINTEHIIKKQYGKLEEKYFLLLKENIKMYQSDVIFEPTFMVSDMLRYCIQKYEPNIKATFVGLLERNNNRVFEFFIPHLDEQECLSDKSIITGNGTVLENAVFDIKKMNKRKYIFRIGGLNSTYIAVREEFAESILRRGAKGIKFIEVDTEE